MRRLAWVLLLFLMVFGCQKGDNTVDPNYDNNLSITLNLPDDALLDDVSGAKMTVTGLDITNPITQTIDWPTDLTAPVIIEAYAPAGSGRHLTLHLLQDDGKATFWSSYSVDVSEGSSINLTMDVSQAAFGSATKIKIFRDNLPWNSEALDDMLADLGIILGTEENEYEVLTSETIDTVVLTAGEDLIIIANDQSQEFYDNYSASQQKIDAFVQSGGTILWEACDLGWANGSIDEAGIDLPGSPHVVSGYDNYNFLTSSLWQITAGMDSVLYGTYASHEGFTNLPSGALTYTLDSRGLPTLVSYSFGVGWVVISGQPLEYAYDRIDSLNTGQLLPNIISFLLGIDPGQSLMIATDGNPNAAIENRNSAGK